MTKVAALDTTLQKTHEWLGDIKSRLGFDNDRAAYAALRAALHALRDQLGTDQVAQLGAQLPMLIRGLYYEGWDPSSGIAGRMQRPDLLDAIRHELRDHMELRDPRRVARIIFGVLDAHLAPGETDRIAAGLPREVRSLWPTAEEKARPDA